MTECPECGKRDLERYEESEAFDYGGRKKPIRVTATLPFKRCRQCGFAFEDGETEAARHWAVYEQLGLQTPDEVRAVRDAYGLTRKEFAALTRLGTATLGRCERGGLIQNGAIDDYLYLLRFPDNLERLRRRRETRAGPGPLAPPRRRTFRTRAVKDPGSARRTGEEFLPMSPRSRVFAAEPGAN